MTMHRLPDRPLCQERLRLIFPPGETRLVSPQAAAAVFVSLYVATGAGPRPIRPSTVLWMSDAAAIRTAPAERDAWYGAAMRSKRAIIELHERWGVDYQPWYADNSREPLRDETFRGWLRYGAIERDDSGPTTAGRPQWRLARAFADLFDPDLDGPALAASVAAWQDEHLGTTGRTRIAMARRLAQTTGQVPVRLPEGSVRLLAAGPSSLILQGVVEELAPRLLGQPSLLALSESRKHVAVVDAELLAELGITLDAQRLLPDAMLFDLATQEVWFVEAVASDGPVNEARKAQLTEWAAGQGIAATSCRFVTAFTSRASAAFRRVVAELAWGSEVWFLDEPAQLVRLEDLRPIPPPPGGGPAGDPTRR